MLDYRTVLVVEDEPAIALELSLVIEEFGGHVVGPVPSVSAAMDILSRQRVAAAILDANLADRDITPVALLLASRKVPFLIHTAVGVPAELAVALPGLPVVLKPHEPERILVRLLAEIRRSDDGQIAIRPAQGCPPAAT